MDLSRLTRIGGDSASEENEFYLALKIETGEVKSAYWLLKDGKAQIVAYGSKEEWGETKEELLVACDASLSQATASLTEETKHAPYKLIFGLPFSWIEKDKIKPERQAYLRFLTDKLSLKPIGFVTVPEAIAFFLKNTRTEIPPAILLYLGVNEITVSLLEDGKVVESEVVGRSGNLALDVEEGVLRFSSVKELPTTIFLYNSGELEEAKQTLLAYPWQPPSETGEKPGFLHLPRVEVLSVDFDIRAVVFAGGEEIKSFLGGEAEEEKKEKVEEEKIEEIAEASPAEEIEFVKEEDISLKFEETEEEVEERKIAEEAIEGETVDESPKEEEAISIKEDLPRKEDQGNQGRIMGTFSSIRNKLLGFLGILAAGFLRFLGERKSYVKKLAFIGVVLVLIIVSFFALFSKAKVIITIVSSRYTQKFACQVDLGISSVNQEARLVPGRVLSVEASGSKKTEATGKKMIGEKAKGEITIYNRTETSKLFPAGLVLVAPNKLKFVLDKEVKVASKTADLAGGLDRWGETKAEVVAEDIGTQYNLGPGNLFNFEKLSQSAYVARNQLAFLGGTSRQITVVSNLDQQKILIELSSELKEKSKRELEGKISPDEILISESIIFEVKRKKFDHEPQDEADELNLDLTYAAYATVVKKTDLLKLALSFLPPGTVSEDGLKINKDLSEVVISSSKEEKNLHLEGEAKIILTSEVLVQEVVASIKGKPVFLAKRALSTLKGVKYSEIKVSPGFFRYFYWLPPRQGRISVETKID